MLFNNPNIVAHPKKITLMDAYKELFKEDIKKQVENGTMKPQTKEEQYDFVMELSKELKEERRSDL